MCVYRYLKTSALVNRAMIKLQLASVASCIQVSSLVLDVPLLTQPSANAPGKAKEKEPRFLIGNPVGVSDC